MSFTNDDLEKLLDVYWSIERDPKRTPHAESLSRIYYACQSALNELDVVESVTGCEQFQSELIEEDTTLIAERQG